MVRRRFVVVGLGSFGYHVARALYERGQDVLAVDHHRLAVEAITPHCSRARQADAADREALEETGAGEADVAIVGLGTRIDASILATLFLKELGVPEVVAKAVSRDHARILQHIGATEVVQPEREMAARLAQHMAEPDVLERFPFLEGYALVEIRAPRSLWGTPLSDSRLRREHRLSVVLLKRREGGREVAVPAQGDTEIREGDILVVLAKGEDVDAFRRGRPG
ncbi:MAG: TrkA family potassium uptake protein [Deferrisomatales bacterium]|nr:TrkA family potassium uptake protein [Deferrisomatales bacterium]